jgi:hypothetical protein
MAMHVTGFACAMTLSLSLLSASSSRTQPSGVLTARSPAAIEGEESCWKNKALILQSEDQSEIDFFSRSTPRSGPNEDVSGAIFRQ